MPGSAVDLVYFLAYARRMNTYIDIDDDLLAQAKAELGTDTKKDTVNAALKFVAERRQRIQSVLGSNTELPPYVGEDIGDPEIMKGARR